MKTFTFTNIEEMIALAKEIQSKVYWGYKFEYCGDSFPYALFWDIVTNVLSADEGYKGVIIFESDEIDFIR